MPGCRKMPFGKTTTVETEGDTKDKSMVKTEEKFNSLFNGSEINENFGTERFIIIEERKDIHLFQQQGSYELITETQPRLEKETQQCSSRMQGRMRTFTSEDRSPFIEINSNITKGLTPH
jgi:hypothetical protein